MHPEDTEAESRLLHDAVSVKEWDIEFGSVEAFNVGIDEGETDVSLALPCNPGSRWRRRCVERVELDI